MKDADFDSMPHDSIDKNGITMHARDLLQTPETIQKTRTKKFYSFPEPKNGNFILARVHIQLLILEYPTRAGVKYAICISFFELYQDRIYDLLDDSQSLIQKRKHLPLKRDVPSGRRYVSGLRKIYASTAEVCPLSPQTSPPQFILAYL